MSGGKGAGIGLFKQTGGDRIWFSTDRTLAPDSDSMAMALRSPGGSMAMVLRSWFPYYGDGVALPVATLWRWRCAPSEEFYHTRIEELFGVWYHDGHAVCICLSLEIPSSVWMVWKMEWDEEALFFDEELLLAVPLAPLFAFPH